MSNINDDQGEVTTLGLPTLDASVRDRALERILREKIIAVLRLPSADLVDLVVESLTVSGISVIEVALTTPDGIDMIRRLSERKELLVGAGTVLDVDTARAAFDAGAAFYASPVFDPDILDVAQREGRLSMPGALTPSEICAASKAGADIVKLFPLPSDGLAYLQAIRGPLPDVRLAPSGGITDRNAADLLKAGAVALNIGSWLTPVGRSGDVMSIVKEMVRRAALLTDAVRGVA